MTPFSRRTDWPKNQNPLTTILEKKRAAGEFILDLTESNPTRCHFSYANPQWLAPLTNPNNLLYEANPKGLLEARQAVARYYASKKILVQPEQIFLTASTSEAYSFLLRLLCDAGDKIAVSRPGYPLFDYLAALNDVDLLSYRLNYENGWRLDEKSLSEAFKQNPKALAIVHPHNPTGHQIQDSEKNQIESLCRQNGAALISDEVFLDYSEGETFSFAGANQALTFTVSGISKILGFPQMKLSWIVVSGPKILAEEAGERLEIIADTYLSVNTPSQRALSEWLAQAPAVQKEIWARICANRKHLEISVKNHPTLKSLVAPAGWYAILATGLRDERAAIDLLTLKNTLVHPGYFFDFEEDDLLVLSLLPETSVFKQGLEDILLI